MKVLPKPAETKIDPAYRRDLQPLVEGRGTYTDDLLPPGTLHLAFVRSQHAHARIMRLDLTEALAVPGVAAVFGPDDARDLPELPISSVVPGQKQDSFPIFYSKALYVGQPLGAIAAESRYQAEDGVDAVIVEYDPLPPVSNVKSALEASSPLLHSAWGDNVAAEDSFQTGHVERVLEGADLVIEETFRTPRQMAIPLETRTILAHYEPSAGTLTVWYSTQTPGPFQTYLSRATGISEGRIRIIVPHVGGGFGNKLHYHPEDVVACVLSVRLGRPVKYVQDRREHFVSTVHSREQVINVRAAVQADGTLTGVEAQILVDAGAHLHTKGNAPAWLTARMIPGPYRVPHYRVTCRAVVTNKTPYGAYRGFGMPQAAFVHERLMDCIASRLNLDPVDVRRRNLIRADEMPYRSSGGLVYDSGDLPELLDRALQTANYAKLRRKQIELRSTGRAYGIGLACVIEYTAMGPSRLMAKAGNRLGGYETAVLRIFPSGDIACYTGIIELGQGTVWGLARICAEHLGVSPTQVTVYSGDTHTVPYSPYGTAASRGMAVGGGAAFLAAREMRARVLRLGAHLLGVPLEDVELAGGGVQRLGNDATRLSLAEIAEEAWRGQRLPQGMEPGLEVKAVYQPENWTFSGQVHVVACEVDRETGLIRFDRYVVAHDAGRVIDPLLVKGQVMGGIAQGIGLALLEEVIYSEDGQPLVGTLMDYILPGLPEIPEITMVHVETPSPLTPGGMKGVGEGGLIGANAGVVNAVINALETSGEGIFTYPLTPERILKALHAPQSPASVPQGQP